MFIGNEVIQYVDPTDDMGDIFDLDTPDVDLLTSSSASAIFPELSSGLNTPQLVQSPKNEVKEEDFLMEEVD